jgi:NADPH:quinone reductase-like Zn-dependent oxidoreductase
VAAAAVHPRAAGRAGHLVAGGQGNSGGPPGPLARPAGLGTELAGVIDAVSPDVRGWEIGQPVFGRSSTRDAVATHALAPADDIVAKPDWLSYAEAAALPIAVETGWRGLRQLGVKPGGTLLIRAAAGGGALVATQLALANGVTVIGTVSEANHDSYRRQGKIIITISPCEWYWSL